MTTTDQATVWLTAADPEPPRGTTVRNAEGIRWTRDDGPYGGPGKANWLLLHRDGKVLDVGEAGAYSWTKVAGNGGPVTVTTPTAPVDLVTFLRARLDEDEAAAPYIHHRDDCDSIPAAASCCGSEDCGCDDTTGPCDCGVPARVLAEVAAKQAIVDLLGVPDPHAAGEPMCAECYVLRHLAAVYSDHEDYREEWKP